MKENQPKNWIKRAFEHTVSALKRIWEWLKRAFTGKGKLPERGALRIESPSALVRGAFFRKKTAVGALIALTALFLFTFIAPIFIPLNVNATDPLQQNVAPNFSLRAVPKPLQGKVKAIDGFSDFSIGVSFSGEIFVWGNTKNVISGTDLQKIPVAVRAEKVEKAAAGKDHIIALTQSGNLIGWGDNSRGQYGGEGLGILPFPKELQKGIDSREVVCLSCGYQASGLVTAEGRAYVWGNLNAVRNLSAFAKLQGVAEIVFTNAAAVARMQDGTLFWGGEENFTAAVSSKNGQISSLNAYLVGRKAEKLAADGKCIAMLLDGGETLVCGAFEFSEEKIPALSDGEYLTEIDGGARHFVGVSNLGKAYAWGDNSYGQCAVNGEVCKKAFAGGMQSYLTDSRGKLQKSVGLKGYLMGTDGRGRDVFARIVHGGKTTLTIGGVAVIVSSLIGVLVGCVSGYFGGAVDVLLMRITEIFSAIPFLPFAMLLSQIIKNYNVSETGRMLMIMLILGALSWTGLARMVRGQVLAEREKEFVVAARAIGVKESAIAFRHVLPNVFSVVLVSMTLDFAGCLLTESSLSYLGFGVQQPRPTWGNMLTGSNNSTVIQNYWWQWLFPALFLALAVICINVIGDALRDALDSKEN